MKPMCECAGSNVHSTDLSLAVAAAGAAAGLAAGAAAGAAAAGAAAAGLAAGAGVLTLGTAAGGLAVARADTASDALLELAFLDAGAEVCQVH